MASSLRFSSTTLALALSSIGAFALACSDGETADAGTGMDATDVEDSGGADADAGAGDARDARPRDADPLDLGAPDLGSCGCSYGFQQQCAEDESCGLGFSGEATCMRAEPFGGTAFGACSTTVTATAAMGAACTAQCVPATQGSPCGAVADRGTVEAYIQSWWRAVSYASQMLPGPGPNAMRDQDISNAGGGSPDACNAFIKWTVLAAASLCRGEGAVIPPDVGYFDQINQWRFRHIEPDDDCQIAAGYCAQALEGGVRAGEAAAAAVDAIPPDCPVLPYGPPCQGADAQTCLRNRIATMIRAINTPLPD